MIPYNELVDIILESVALKDEGIERKRELEIKKVLFVPKPLKVITGLRRSGKSFLLKRLYTFLIAKGIPRENILFINFENDRLSFIDDTNQLREVYDLFLSGTISNKPVYLFFDEIQNVRNWEKFIRTIYDSTEHHIYITGSNAQLLSKEFASTLGGRILEYDLFPFSFKEMLEYKAVSYQNAFDRSEFKNDMNRLFSDYLNFGGICEAFDLPKEAKIAFRKSLIDKIVVNDIAERYNLRSFELLKNLMQYLEKNTGNIISYRKIANVAGASEPTIEQYVSYLESAWIIEKLKKFSWKTKGIFDTSKKFYFTDNLFCHFADIEDKLENVCYQHLAREYGINNIFLGRDDKGKEVDFIVKTDGDRMLGFQVCYHLTEENLKREISSLQLLEKHMQNNTTQLFVISMYQNHKTPLPKQITHLNMIDFLVS
jgi:predicted AAA+ superfamily ATPase